MICHRACGVSGRGAQRDFPILEELAVAGATDYFAELIPAREVLRDWARARGYSESIEKPELLRVTFGRKMTYRSTSVCQAGPGTRSAVRRARYPARSRETVHSATVQPTMSLCTGFRPA
jgi:hypothetical protein